MKYFHDLQIDEPTLPRHEFEEICRLKPECRTPSGFRYKFSHESEEGDEFLRHVLALVRRLGIPRRRIANATHYGYSITRWYDDPDFLAAEYLVLHYQRRLKSFDGPKRDEAGRLLVLASESKSNLKFGSTYPENRIIVSDSVRKNLESAQLVGLKFHPMSYKGKSSAATTEPPWELDSTITLPRLANSHLLLPFGKVPETSEYFGVVSINDAPFCKAELHYRRSDLASLGSFDIANTLEKVFCPHPLVISQRFYQHCLKSKIPLEVEPVRIDPD